MKSAGKPVTRIAGARAPRRARNDDAGARIAPAPVPHDRFAERLRAIESEVERVYAETGGEAASGSRLTDAAEALLATYARVARDVESGEALAGLRRLVGVDALFGSDATPQVSDPLVGPLLSALYRFWWRVEVTGLEHVPRSGPVLLVANHSGGLLPHDAAMLATALAERRDDRDARPLLDDHVCDLPLLAELGRRIGGVRARPEHAERLLAAGQAVIAFPEGLTATGKPYAHRYRVQRFARGGHVRAALRVGAPVLPVAIVGAEEAHPVLGRWDWLGQRIGLPYLPLTPTFPWLGLLGLVPLPSKWRIEIGAPLPWSGRVERGISDRALIAQRNEDVRQRVQRLVAEALERRGHAFL